MLSSSLAKPAPWPPPCKLVALFFVCALGVCALGPLPALAGEPQSQATGREALRRQIDALLSQPPLLGAHCSVQVDSLEDGQTLYARSPDDLLNPASNTKLVTSAAALLRLGPEYRFATDFLSDKPLRNGRTQQLIVKGRGDPSINTERLAGLVADLWHRGLRSVGELVLDDTHFDREPWGPGWEQESSDKSWAAPVGALSINHNSVAIYVVPAERAGTRARVELEPDPRDYFLLENRVTTVAANGRRKLRPHTSAQGERTRVVVEGRVAVRADGQVLFRRVTDPTFYYGQTLKMLLQQRGIRVSGQVRRGVAPATATLLASYDSPELSEIVRDMNKVSSNFIAEMLIKTLGAEIKGPPGTWPKGLEVTSDLLAELGIARGTYQLRNGSGLNDTNRFSARELTTLLGAVWKRFPVAAEFVASLGIAARDGTMRLRMEGTDAAGRLRAKTGTLEHVTALSGYVQSLGGERFAFSVLVNDWTGRASPVLSSVDRLGGLIASLGGPEQSDRDASIAALAAGQPREAAPAELRARVVSYVALARAADKKNLPFLRSALRTERDPALRAVAAEALYRTDADQGGGPLLEAAPASPELAMLFVRLRAVDQELGLPVPLLPSLLDLAVDGSGEALARLLTLAPLARGAVHDTALEALLTAGFVEVGDASPDEFFAALRTAPPAQALAGIELAAVGLAQAGTEAAHFPLTHALEAGALAQPAEAAQLQGWLAVLERRFVDPVETTIPAGIAALPAAVAAPAPSAAPVTAAAQVAVEPPSSNVLPGGSVGPPGAALLSAPPSNPLAGSPGSPPSTSAAPAPSVPPSSAPSSSAAPAAARPSSTSAAPAPSSAAASPTAPSPAGPAAAAPAGSPAALATSPAAPAAAPASATAAPSQPVPAASVAPAASSPAVTGPAAPAAQPAASSKPLPATSSAPRFAPPDPAARSASSPRTVPASTAPGVPAASQPEGATPGTLLVAPAGGSSSTRPAILLAPQSAAAPARPARSTPQGSCSVAAPCSFGTPGGG